MTESDSTDPRIFHLVYVSSATRQINKAELRDIRKTAQRNNKQAYVTGVLLYCNGKFMQFLEGPELQVRRIFSAIKSDARHCKINVLKEGFIPQRQFSDWHMRYTPLGDVQKHQGVIFNKLFDLATCKKKTLEYASESMSLLLAFKTSNMSYSKAY